MKLTDSETKMLRERAAKHVPWSMNEAIAFGSDLLLAAKEALAQKANEKYHYLLEQRVKANRLKEWGEAQTLNVAAKHVGDVGWAIRNADLGDLFEGKL